MREWFKILAAALAALSLLMAAPAMAQVPDPFARELAQKLARAEQLVGAEGYSRAAGPFAGGLRSGEARAYTLMLRSGQDYRLVGVCDERCRDFDLRIFDANGRVIAQDVLTDAVPIVHLRPYATGNYTIEASMPRCDGAQCWYAFNVYAR
ncbi:MAG: hypothetical protein R3C16_03330 [Hyphomonadaceae bacterium]